MGARRRRTLVMAALEEMSSESEEELVEEKIPQSRRPGVVSRRHRVLVPSRLHTVPIFSGREERSSESEEEVVEVKISQRPGVVSRRRRVLDPSRVHTVPIYSGRVNRTLQLYRENSAEFHRNLRTQVEQSDSDEDLSAGGGNREQRRLSPRQEIAEMSNSDTEPENGSCRLVAQSDGSPSPPSSPSLPTLRTQQVATAIREVNQQLKDLEDFCASPPGRVGSLDSDDVVLIETLSDIPLSPRVLTLKIRCRGLIHRVPLRVTDALQKAVDQLASKLQIERSRLLLLQHEFEVPLEETPESRNLSVADILDCFILSDVKGGQGGSDFIRLQVRSQEKGSLQSITIRKTDPLKTLMSVYEERMGLGRDSVRFLFDGVVLSESSVPADLEMERDDVIDACFPLPSGV